MRLLVLDREVAAAEQRLVAARSAFANQAVRTQRAVKDRLSHPDMLIASAGLGTLYGLWVTRSNGGRKDRLRKGSSRMLPVPGWLVRATLSMVVTRLLSGPGAGEAQVSESMGVES